MTLVTPLLGIPGAGIVGGLWGAGLLSDRMASAGFLFVLFVALALEFMAWRRGGALEPRGHGQDESAVHGPSENPVQPVAGSMGTSLSRLLDGVGVAFLVTDRGGTVLRAGDSAAALLERGPDEQLSVLNCTGTFFGLPVEDPSDLESVQDFFGDGAGSGEGLVTIAGSRRQIRWAARALDGSEGLGAGRMLIMRDVTAERQFEVLKSDFLATVSHELRTPLTSLRGSLQLVVGRADALGSMDRQLLEIGIKNSEKLIGLINDLLDVDALEHGCMAFQFTTLDLKGLVSVAAQSVAGTFEEREIAIEIDSEENLPTVHGDRERLLQVLVSLLRNAAKHSPSGSTVTLRVRGRDSGIQVDVCDRGPGIPAADQPHVFERFWGAHRNGTDAGAGLGLAICRAVIVRHGGQIWLESEEGKGATFCFFLPRSIFRYEEDDSRGEMPAPAGSTVLLIEGDADSQAVLKTLLEQCGYAVMAVPTGAQGVAAVRREQPEAVVLDLVLSDISGYDVLRILKNSPETAAVPVLILGVEPDRELARGLGAWDVLQKPVEFESLKWSVAEALRHANQPEGFLVVGMGPSVSRDLGVLAWVLERDGHKIHRAPDVDGLVRWAETNFPDVLVLDDDFLPGTRDATAEQLCHRATHCSIPLVFLTTAAGSDREVSALWTCLRKPISKDDFLCEVRRILTEVRNEAGRHVHA